MTKVKRIKGIQDPTEKNPRVLAIYSLPKTGKTECLAQLENHFILDFDQSSGFYRCNAEKIPDYNAYIETMMELKEMKIENNGKLPYKYIILDTVTTATETVIRAMAVMMYNKEEGENKPLNWDITSLSYGKGYGYIREATKLMIEQAKRYGEYVIVVGHVADKSVNKNGTDLTIKELDLPGKLKNILAANVDGLALMYRKDKNTNVLSFIHDESDVLGGTRAQHLNGQEIVISEKTDIGLKTYWDKIYI